MLNLNVPVSFRPHSIDTGGCKPGHHHKQQQQASPNKKPAALLPHFFHRTVPRTFLAAMQNYSGTGGTGSSSNPFYFSTPIRGGSSSSLSAQTPGSGAAAADGMARIKAKLDELDRVSLEGRHEDGKLLQEQQKVTLLAEVGYKAIELSKTREQLAQAQQRKMVAEERLRAHELIGQMQQTIEDALVCTGRKPGGH